jgi:protein-tyrosine phosphatase
MIPMYSDYFTVLKPGPNVVNTMDDQLEFLLKVVGACVGVTFIILLVLCLYYEHSKRKARHHGVEMHNLQTTLRHVFRNRSFFDPIIYDFIFFRNLYHGLKGGRHQLVAHNPPDIPSIPKENLLAAYNERQTDSGYGFQHEFELLPDCFSDRTMDASEAKENQSKNRYPDIKAYDQTRVKLSQMDSVVGSDYINANVVMSYKERKKFICAQGPTDVTVNDFWRMIWEYNLDLVVMLTNLEEYSKVKCSKYWPDQHQQDKLFNNINVHHVSEKRYQIFEFFLRRTIESIVELCFQIFGLRNTRVEDHQTDHS